MKLIYCYLSSDRPVHVTNVPQQREWTAEDMSTYLPITHWPGILSLSVTIDKKKLLLFKV